MNEKALNPENSTAGREDEVRTPVLSTNVGPASKIRNLNFDKKKFETPEGRTHCAECGRLLILNGKAIRTTHHGIHFCTKCYEWIGQFYDTRGVKA